METYLDTIIQGERAIHVSLLEGTIRFSAGGLDIELPEMTDQQINELARFLARGSSL